MVAWLEMKVIPGEMRLDQLLQADAGGLVFAMVNQLFLGFISVKQFE
jgi:hypothetical protein